MITCNYDSDTFIEFRKDFNADRRSLVEKIINLFNIPEKGLVIIFDAESLSDYKYNLTWRMPANYMNVKRGGIEELSPAHLLNHMKLKKYEHLIWISLEICDKPDIEFTWILSHEIGHLKQAIKCYELFDADLIIKKLLSKEIPDGERPLELEANLKAFEAVSNIFGINTAKSHVREKIEIKQKSGYFEPVLKFCDSKYDAIESTILILEKYYDKILKSKKTSDCKHVRNYDLSRGIEKIKSYVNIF